MPIPMVEASEADAEAIVSMFWILAVALAAPLVTRASRHRVPEVVVLLGLGVVIGPTALGLASTDGGVSLVSELGLGMLFLLAGYELDPEVVASRTGRVAALTWVVCAALALVGALLVLPWGDATTAVAVAIALTSTALGTLLPILRDRGLLGTPLGRAVLAHGAVGELLPVLAMAMLLSSRNVGGSLLVLSLFAVLALALGRLPGHALARVPGLDLLLRQRAGGTSQVVVRGVLLLLISLMALAAVFSLDVVLGAFAAGAILRRLQTDHDALLEDKLEVIAFSLLVPVFFVVSGMGISVDAVADYPLGPVAVVLLIGVARGLPVWLAERWVPTGSGLTTAAERRQLALYAATGLPIVVAVTQVAVNSGLMLPDAASVLVAGAALTVLVFPLLAGAVASRSPHRGAAVSSPPPPVV